MGEKLLTVIVPSYNMEAYLAKGLGSLVVDDKDILDRLEVIVVNDGSTDRTSEIAHLFEAKYPGVFRVIDKSNGHYGSCINAALPVATGTFVKIMDADDSFDTDGLTSLLSALEKNAKTDTLSDVDLVCTDYVLVNDGGEEVNRISLKDNEEGFFNLAAMSSYDIGKLWMQAVAYRTTNLLAQGYRQQEKIPFTDQDWMFYPLAKVSKFLNMRVVVYKYLVGRDGQTVNPAYYIRHFSVQRMLTQKFIRGFADLASTATSGGIRYLKERILARASLVYRYHLIIYSKAQYSAEESEFEEFDKVLREELPEIYSLIGGVRLLRRVPIGLVDAWHRKQSGHPFRYWLLKDVCMPLVRLRNSLSSWPICIGVNKLIQNRAFQN